MVSSRRISLPLRGFSRDVVEGQAERCGLPAAKLLELAAEHHLSDHGPRRLARDVPSFAFESGPGAERDFEISLEPSTWAQLELESELTGVSLDRLLAHAALRFAADVDAGRVVARVLAEGA
jgi:hypothetical protein